MRHGDGDLAVDSVPDSPRGPETLKEEQVCAKGEKKSRTNQKSAKGSSERDFETKEEAEGKDSATFEKKDSKPRSLFGADCFQNVFASGPVPGAALVMSSVGSVHVGNSLNITFAAPSAPKGDGSKHPSPLLKDVIGSRKALSLDELDVAAEHVGRRWKRVGEHLGFSQGQMERIHDEHRHISIKEVVYQLLLEWRQSRGEGAGVGLLCGALCAAGQLEAAERLALAHAQCAAPDAPDRKGRKDV